MINTRSKDTIKSRKMTFRFERRRYASKKMVSFKCLIFIFSHLTDSLMYYTIHDDDAHCTCSVIEPNRILQCTCQLRVDDTFVRFKKNLHNIPYFSHFQNDYQFYLIFCISCNYHIRDNRCL